VLALHLDAGKDKGGKRRELFVVLDKEAEVVDVIEGNARPKLRLMNVPVMEPTLDVKAGVHREFLRRKRQGNPKVQQRRNGRWHERKNRLLSATMGERSGTLTNLLIGSLKS
jgi:hypothetical protein